MSAWLAKYNKLWMAIAGFALLFFMKRAEIDLPGVDAAVTELLVSLLAGWGVYQVANTKPVPEDEEAE